jgi:hypothetical protein
MVHTTLRKKLVIVSGYNPPTNTLRREEVLELFPIQAPAVVMGDMNSKHRAWNCTMTNSNGNTILNVFTDNNITIATPPSPTHYPPRGQASTLDVAMYRGCTISTPQAIPALSSDHNPVVYKVRLTPLHMTKKTFFDYRNVNWTRYQQLITSTLTQPSSITGEEEFDRALTTFTTTILTAAEQTIPKRTVQGQRPPLPSHIRNLLRIRNYVRLQYQRTRQAWLGYTLQICNELTATSLGTYYNMKWDAFLSTLHPSRAPIWRVVRHLKTRREDIPPLLHQGNMFYTAKQKANLLASCFEENHKITTPLVGTSFDYAVDRLMDKFRRRRSPKTDGIPRFHTYTVQRLLRQLRPRTAPGINGVTNSLLRHLPPPPGY